jgi:hypothetical protein
MLGGMPLSGYFRAPDADAVRQVLDAGGGRTPVGDVFDGIEAKGGDPAGAVESGPGGRQSRLAGGLARRAREADELMFCWASL